MPTPIWRTATSCFRTAPPSATDTARSSWRGNRSPARRSRAAPSVVASPGARTTAHLALSLWAPGAARSSCSPSTRSFRRSCEGRLIAGVLIHEGQLTFAGEGLAEVVDLGRWWKEETGLPLPLGGNVVRRDLGAGTDRPDLAGALPLDRVRPGPPRGGARRMPCATRGVSTGRAPTASSGCTSTTGPAATARRAGAPCRCCWTGVILPVSFRRSLPNMQTRGAGFRVRGVRENAGVRCQISGIRLGPGSPVPDTWHLIPDTYFT